MFAPVDIGWQLPSRKEPSLPDVSETSAKAVVFLEAARNWVSQSSNSGISGSHQLKRQIGLALYRQSKLEAAVSSRMSIGVYGASQAGKSYFVSALAKGVDESVSALIGTKEVNFLTEINPSGGKESTGLVTRFTREPLAASTDFPIRISLLSEMDLVKILANSFYADLELDTEGDLASRTSRGLGRLDGLASAGGSTITVEEVADLSFYCDKHFSNNNYYSTLKQAGYWGRLEQLAPISDLRSRQRLYSLLWDSSPPYERLFALLSNELARFSGATSLMCDPSALFEIAGDVWSRSESSVINVTALEMLGNGQEKQVKVRSFKSTASIGIGVLSALASEITINIASAPHEFFEKADLLDFPGARSRHPINRQRFEELEELPTDHFLRGKVAYLFERYCSNYGMSALLLCLGPSNQEVVGLNRLIEDWIVDAVGARPDQREGQPENLFAVLTKFDNEFVMDAGRSLDESRWSTRVTASLVKPFGGQQSARTCWLDNWDSRSAFKNTYWWRSPSADQSGLIKYGPNRTELAIIEERKADVDALRVSYLRSELVQRHFRNPEEAWNSALTLNDGGAQYLVSNLALVCSPELRGRQIHSQILQNCESIASQLRRHYVAAGTDDMQATKRRLADSFILSARDMMAKGRAGEFLSDLVIDEQRGVACYEELCSELRLREPFFNLANAQVKVDLTGLDDVLGLSSPQEVIAQRATQSDILVKAFIEHWARSIREKFRNPGLLDYFGITPDFVEVLCDEAVTGFERLGGVRFISVALDSQHYSNQSSWQSATILTTLLNDFLIYTVLNRDRAREVTTAAGKKTQIFSNISVGRDEQRALEISESTRDYSRQFLVSWALGFFEMIKQNAFIDLRDEQMIKENERLGSLLGDLASMQVN
jgi:hypothetical protein